VKQVLQSLKNGVTEVAQVPVPLVKPGCLQICTNASLVSVGTERMLVEFGRASLLEKVRQQPEKVQLVLDKIKTDGLLPTIDSVINKLDKPLSMGYCNVGRVTEIGFGVSGFDVGDRVISNGNHAEVVVVPKNLCAKVPDEVSDEEASFTVLAAIALQGVRLTQPTLGETVVVMGLGLIGLITVQLLRANGCRVLGIDFDRDKLALAREFGAETIDLSTEKDPVKVAESYSRNRGVDAVIVTASTQSSEPIHQAALMCRKRGRIVLVGVTGLNLLRDDFYKKELTFQVSASYGPGRYDSNYEEKGQDYPVGYVRWTEQRNFEAVLDLMSKGLLNLKALISHRFFIDEAEKAYELLMSDEPSLGIILKYTGIELNYNAQSVTLNVVAPEKKVNVGDKDATVNISFIGAGNYAMAMLIPVFKDAGAGLYSVASNTGVSGLHAGRKHGFFQTTTDPNTIFSEKKSHAIVVTTQHDSHARYVLQALEAGKHVFVEKPLCLNLIELEEIEAAYKKACEMTVISPVLMVGFNRRFAPQVQKIKRLLRGVTGPKSCIITVNAGAIPIDHWTQNADVGGGRIIGEACHFIDLLRFLMGSPIENWSRLTMNENTSDTAVISLKFKDGSIGTVHYLANGSKAFPKERLEVFAAGGVLQLDNYRKLTGYGWPGFKKMNLWRQDKGQKACAKSFVDSVSTNGVAPIPINEIFEVSRVSIEIAR
jgi:predicted dehydrogenase/threonine dehydrogenase-like Zn-dependent dehydrogenase